MALSPDKHLGAGLSLTLWSGHVCPHTKCKHCRSPSNSGAFDVLFTEVEGREVMAAEGVHKEGNGGRGGKEELSFLQ